MASGTGVSKHPNGKGFDTFHGFLGDMMDDYYYHQRHGHHYMRKNKEVIHPKGHATDLFAQWATASCWSRLCKKSLFLLYLAFNAPHTPIQPPKSWLHRVKAREDGISHKRASLVALIEHLDAAIGSCFTNSIEPNSRKTPCGIRQRQWRTAQRGCPMRTLRGGKQDIRRRHQGPGVCPLAE